MPPRPHPARSRVQAVYAKAKVMAHEIAATMRAALSAARAITTGGVQEEKAAHSGVCPDARIMVVTRSRAMVVAYTVFLRAFLRDLMGECWGGLRTSVSVIVNVCVCVRLQRAFLRDLMGAGRGG